MRKTKKESAAKMKKTVFVGSIVINGHTVPLAKEVEATPAECLTALTNARTPREFYIAMRRIGFTVHAYDDFTSISLDSVGDVMEFSGAFLDDFKEDAPDNPPYFTLLWNYRCAFIDAYRQKVVEAKED